MDEHTVATIRDWEGSSYAGGYGGLHDLADRGFSGAVHADPHWLFMVNGRVVGVYAYHDNRVETQVRPADIEVFEDATGTAYTAPHNALALLYAMQAADGSERARYYTGNTPLPEVDGTLSDGGFTGYVELSENVLSGDYYVIYQGGRSSSVAYIGNSRRLITDVEAFDRAADEVGIYRVVAVDLSVIEVPGAPEPEPEASGVAAGAVATTVESEAKGGNEAEAATAPTADPVESVDRDDPDESALTDERVASVDATTEDEPEEPIPAITEVEPAAADAATGADNADASEPPESAPEPGPEVAELRAKLDEQRAIIADLREQVAALTAERDRLERELEPPSEANGGTELATPPAPASGPALSVADARAETSLFVRYRSKGQPTLEDVSSGAERSAVAENLSIEHHTTFESEGATVDGEPFEAYLTGLQEYRFLEWLVDDLVYEIRDTRNSGSMERLYEALQRIDRVEFDGSVSPEGGETHQFDLVARDRMGNALIVTRMNDAREPIGEAPLAALVRDTTAIAEKTETLAGAFAVTASYFEPAALATADEATGGSLLSRDKRKSFVKLSRRQGYHLGLVEARGGSFNLTVPDL